MVFVNDDNVADIKMCLGNNYSISPQMCGRVSEWWVGWGVSEGYIYLVSSSSTLSSQHKQQEHNEHMMTK